MSKRCTNKSCCVDWRTLATLWTDTVIILVTLVESHSCHRHLNVKSMKRHTKIHKHTYICFNRKLLERKFCTATCGHYDKIFWENKRSLVAEDRGSLLKQCQIIVKFARRFYAGR